MEVIECWYGKNSDHPQLIGWLVEDEDGFLRYERFVAMGGKEE